MYRKFELPLKERDMEVLKTVTSRFCVVGLFSSFADNCSANGVKSTESILKQLVGRVPSAANGQSSEEDSTAAGMTREAFLELTGWFLVGAFLEKRVDHSHGFSSVFFFDAPELTKIVLPKVLQNFKM